MGESWENMGNPHENHEKYGDLDGRKKSRNDMIDQS
jgi:hypothetical protein